MTSQRWFCRSCEREWLDITETAMGAAPWAPEQGCIACGSPSIEYVKFTPAFRGGDIPRDVETILSEPFAGEAQIPPLVLIAKPRTACDWAPEFT